MRRITLGKLPECRFRFCQVLAFLSFFDYIHERQYLSFFANEMCVFEKGAQGDCIPLYSCTHGHPDTPFQVRTPQTLTKYRDAELITGLGSIVSLRPITLPMPHSALTLTVRVITCLPGKTW